MPTQIEARRLSGIDRGKHVSLEVPGGRYTGPWLLEGTLTSITHFGSGTISLIVARHDGPALGTGISPETRVTITGQPRPAPPAYPTGPDCTANKHTACDNRALDETTDQIVHCHCTCHI